VSVDHLRESNRDLYHPSSVTTNGSNHNGLALKGLSVIIFDVGGLGRMWSRSQLTYRCHVGAGIGRECFFSLADCHGYRQVLSPPPFNWPTRRMGSA